MFLNENYIESLKGLTWWLIKTPYVLCCVQFSKFYTTFGQNIKWRGIKQCSHIINKVITKRLTEQGNYSWNDLKLFRKLAVEVEIVKHQVENDLH